MAVHTRAVHTLTDRDSCSMSSSVSIPHTADDVITNTYSLLCTPLLSVSPTTFPLRMSFLTATNTIHRNHHHNNVPMTLVMREPHGSNWNRFRRPTQVCRMSGGSPLASASRVGTAGCRPGVSIYKIMKLETP